MAYKIPIVDFSDYSSRLPVIAQEIFEACTTIGFFYIVNHDIPKEEVMRQFEISKEFYDLSYKEKEKWAIKDNRGYTGLFKQKLDPSHQRIGDNKEAFNFGPFQNGASENPLPEAFEKHRSEIAAFSRATHETALKVLRAFAVALEIPEEEGGIEWFTKRHQYDSPHSAETLRYLKYPRGPESEFTTEPVRAGAHTDYGSITLLFQKDVPGLEVEASRTEWISAPIIDGAVLVNVGGILEYWTKGLFKATMHRVVFMPEHQHKDRYSIACFLQPERHVALAPIPSKHIPSKEFVAPDIPEGSKIETSNDYLQLRLQAAYAITA